jgi:hypothetical protein
VNESITIKIRYKPFLENISLAELNLLESMLPEIISAMQELQSNRTAELITETKIATELESECCK